MIAESADVEILLMEEQHLGFFPADIQKFILSRVKLSKFVGRPFTNQQIKKEMKKFANWDEMKDRYIDKTVQMNHHRKVAQNPRDP